MVSPYHQPLSSWIRAISTITFTIKLPIVPSIVVAVIVPTVIAATSKNTIRRLAFSLLRDVIQDGCANKYIKESHKIIDLRLISSSCHLSHDFYYQP